PRHLYSFPTRRSSDLSDRSTGRCDHGGGGCGASAGAVAEACRMSSAALGISRESFARDRARAVIVLLALLGAAAALLLGSTAFRSEEHTSELQSRENL